MSDELRTAQEAMYSTTTIYQASTDQSSRPRKRNLGGAIFLAAIADYRGMDPQAHKDAERFLYPQTAKGQEHYDWAVALADGVNPAWLRDALDKFRSKWDWQRFERTALKSRRAQSSRASERRQG